MQILCHAIYHIHYPLLSIAVVYLGSNSDLNKHDRATGKDGPHTHTALGRSGVPWPVRKEDLIPQFATSSVKQSHPFRSAALIETSGGHFLQECLGMLDRYAGDLWPLAMPLVTWKSTSHEPELSSGLSHKTLDFDVHSAGFP